MEKLAELNLMGIQTEEDLYLQFAKERGYINTDRIVNVMHPEAAKAAQDKTERDKRYVRGMLSSRARPRGDWGVNNRDTNALNVTNKSASAFPFKAYESGKLIGGEQKPFSAIPVLTYDSEKQMQTRALMNSLLAK